MRFMARELACGRAPANVMSFMARKDASKRRQEKVGRNDPCPCGSEMKYKKCHGKGP
jgi:uncharacterized protein YecA (UPF0149 family)